MSDRFLRSNQRRKKNRFLPKVVAVGIQTFLAKHSEYKVMNEV